MAASAALKADFPTTLLLTFFPFNQRVGSAAHLAPLLREYGSKILWYAFRAPVPGVSGQENAAIAYAYSDLLNHPYRMVGLRAFLNHTIWSYKLGMDSARFAKNRGIQLVWAYLQPHVLIAARTAAHALRVPLAVVVNDDPINAVEESHTIRWLLPWIKRYFAATLNVATSHAVVSEAMADVYKDRYGIDPAVLYVGVEDNQFLPSRGINRDSYPIMIGSIGRYYKMYEPLWKALVDAVRILNVHSRDARFRILHIGNLREDTYDSSLVEVTGEVTGDEFVQQLKRITVGIVQLPFDSYVETARTSFPTRISSFVQAQCPIIAFGPQDSTIVRFVEKYQCGLTCIQADASALAGTIRRLAFDEGVYESAQAAMGRLKDTFSMSNYFRSFETFISAAVSRH